ncbi:unnamed protein product [Diplocarpon coronariae]|uniref:rRNA methylase n=1 Tax=Diplocarpon coronariae TaxID=2795749 RepID=A0A218YV66_9HELO|nr:rRNA methylase [Marssonina coronariae]
MTKGKALRNQESAGRGFASLLTTLPRLGGVYRWVASETESRSTDDGKRGTRLKIPRARCHARETSWRRSGGRRPHAAALRVCCPHRAAAIGVPPAFVELGVSLRRLPHIKRRHLRSGMPPRPRDESAPWSLAGALRLPVVVELPWGREIRISESPGSGKNINAPTRTSPPIIQSSRRSSSVLIAD